MVRKLLGTLLPILLVFNVYTTTSASAEESDNRGHSGQMLADESTRSHGQTLAALDEGLSQEGEESGSPSEGGENANLTKQDVPDFNLDSDPAAHVDVYRVYNPRTGGHLYTTSATESTKLIDSGWYDEGIAWRSPVSSSTPVYRLYNPGNGAHIYSADAHEASALTGRGWKNEGIVCYSDKNASIAIYRLRNSSGGSITYHFASSEAEKNSLVSSGWTNEGIAFYASGLGEGKAWPAGAPAFITDVKVYRLYNSFTNEHLYTLDANEVAILSQNDWYSEGIAWVSPSWSRTPVYRLYNPTFKDHHYTTDLNEIRMLTTNENWQNEGIVWYSSPGKEVAVYRQFQPALMVGSHNYTADPNEYKVNNSRGWQGEGVAWYATAGGQPEPTVREMISLAQRYSSATNWLILVNNSTTRVGIFQRENGKWILRHYWISAPGSDSTPTVKGEFTVANRGYSFGKSYTCYYWVQFYGDYLFHSILYNRGTFQVQDGRLGQRVSHGCVRLSIENAKWIYDNIPRRTKVVSY